MGDVLELNEDRLFPPDPGVRSIARRLYAGVRDLPIVSPHGHTDPAWFADDVNFPNPADLFIKPDHYLYRMLYSQGVALERLGIPRVDGGESETDPRKVWRLFAENYYLFRGAPSKMWLDHALYHVFDIRRQLKAETADEIYDRIHERLARPEFSARSLFDRFRIEVLTTTESPLDDLKHHRAIAQSDWPGRVLTAFRPDNVVDPEFEGFADNVARLGDLTSEDTSTWGGYLAALAQRREFFKRTGSTSTDHGHPSALTADLSRAECERLFDKALSGRATSGEAELFRGQMLMEMARMSLDDGLVMQIHPGSFRNHNPYLFERFGRDKGADIPIRTEYVRALKPLLDKLGNEPGLTIILFTLDETVYSRELAPLAGVYPCLKLGPAWWFYDSPQGMARYREQVIETAGFYNTVGFNDDTRAFLSIPARHDVARRMDCSFLARLVAEHRMDEDEAHELAVGLAGDLARRAYGL